MEADSALMGHRRTLKTLSLFAQTTLQLLYQLCSFDSIRTIAALPVLVARVVML